MEIPSITQSHRVRVFVFMVCSLWGFCVGSNSILSFSVTDSTATYISGADLTLLCEAKETYSTIEIRRANTHTSLSKTQASKSLKYQLLSVNCTDVGIYECLVDQMNTQTMDIALSDCGPCLCQDDEGNKTIFVNINETVQFSFCVVAYKDIHTSAKFNNTLVSWKGQCWRWDYQLINSSSQESNRFNITVTRDQLGIDHYGLLTMRLFGSNGCNYFLDYYIMLHARGPSECPTNISVTGQGLDYIVLSWKPGLDGGYGQTFHVYYSKDDAIWHKHKTECMDAALNVTGLETNTTYFLKVVSSNNYSAGVNETGCDNMIMARTGNQSNEDKNLAVALTMSNPKISPLHVKVLIGVFLSLLVPFLAFILWRLKDKWNKQTRQSEPLQSRAENQQNEADEEVNPKHGGVSSLTNDQLNPGEYISEEGLKYLTLAQIQKTFKHRISKNKVRGQEKTEYVVLDFSKTGKVQL